ncbi:MAG TPA: acyl-CoA dehydrogenase [Syntrophomonadaceae bacterium]|nr:acyl-CoA dehydrogenase [Syntrophomonadaceae bacterium]HPU49722.1 acyl-CoA dehydrogenase [Syntrophomonadaceae bacterium]
MASNYIYSTRDHLFLLKEWLDLSKVLNTERFKDTYSIDDIDAILNNALRIAQEVIAPTNKDGDKIQAQFENGKVRIPESMKKAYHFIQSSGLGPSNKNRNDESALPLCILGCAWEYLAAANPALAPYFVLSAGACNLIQTFGDDKLKNLFLPKMFSGQWTGTMAVTEPGGSSDLGDLLTKAYPTDEPGVYKIKGTKCFITGAEQDITENIVHLVLARVEGAAPGLKGLSVFVVPKYWLDEKGEAGEFNDINCISIEDKMGMKGSATCLINFGEDNNCRGYILGDPPDENGAGQGTYQMFKMMNEERLNTGHGAVAAAAAAYYHAANYASQRIQGRLLSDLRGPRVPIIRHEDIRRNLMFQKSHIEGLRAVIVYNLYLLDLAEWSDDKELAAQARDIVDLSTPIIKAYASDMAFQCINEALQIFGGYGYTEDYPISQMLRDSRIFCIWEGTNYLQSLDLVARKWTKRKGTVFAGWLQSIQDFIDKNKDNPDFAQEFALLQKGLDNYRQIQAAIVGYLGQGKIGMIGLYATRILHSTGKIYCGKVLLDMALVAQKKIKELGPDHYDYPFYQGKVASARFYLQNIVPEIDTTLEIIKAGDTSALDVEEKAFLV